MVKTVSLTEYHHYRIWIDELPGSVDAGSREMQFSIANGGGATEGAGRTRGAIENFIFGSKSRYALLGGEFHRDKERDVFVSVKYGSYHGAAYCSEIAPECETIHAELPDEYLDGVMEGLRAVIVSADVSGTLSITVGAHCLIDSSHSIFKRTAMLLFRLLANPEIARDDEALRALLLDVPL